MILRKLAEERELTPAGQPVLIMGTHDRGYVVRAALSDREVVQLKLGDPAEICMDAYPSQSIAGSLAEIAGASDSRSGMFPIEVRFDSVPVSLASGLVAKLNPALVRFARSGSSPYVPIGAVVEGERRSRQRVRRRWRSRQAPPRARRLHRAWKPWHSMTA